jgi:GT2 family glycosyltransferase
MIDFDKVTIIIPHLGESANEEYSIEQCVRSLIETVPQMKILIAKNGVNNCTHASDVWTKKQGQGIAVNAAVATVNTEWIMVSNSDMVYPPNWWENLTNGLSDDVLCVSPKLIEPRPGALTFGIYFCGGAGGDFDKEKWLNFAKDYQGQGLRTGFNLPFLIKRDVFNLIGQYDINFDPWGSNSDSCLQTRIMLAGIQPMQNTNAIVYHFSQTSGTGNPENRPFWQRNWDYYINKYGFERKSSPDIWTSQNIIDYDKLKFHPWWEGYYAKKML